MNKNTTGVYLLTCSGISNTGKLTTQVSMRLMQRYPGLIEECLRCSPTVSLSDNLSGAEQLVILDGCEDHCAAKKAALSGRKPDIHIVTTDCGITKSGMNDPTFNEIDHIVEIVRTALSDTS